MSIQPAAPLTEELEALIEDYRRWLVVERALAPSTVARRVVIARRFLSACADRDLELLSLQDVIDFVLAQSLRLAVKSTQGLATALRSVLGYLYLVGVTDNELGLGVPAPSGPHATALPRWIPAGELEALLASSDTTTARGARNHAIVVLLARLGLRAGEVAGLRLDDLDWSAGEIVVRGKGSRTERLPARPVQPSEVPRRWGLLGNDTGPALSRCDRRVPDAKQVSSVSMPSNRTYL